MIAKKLLLAGMALFAVVSASARPINVSGLITVKDTNEEASGASIIDANTNKLVGVAGEDGRYNITVDSDAELIFRFLGAEEQKEKVKGRHILNVELMPLTTYLTEVAVSAKGGKKATMSVDPTDLDLDGNTLHFKTKVKLPKHMMNADRRLIVQPAIYNVTKNHVSYLKPVVLDGWHYAATQERMYDWDKSRDSLTVSQQIRRGSKESDNILYVLDSLYVANPKDDFIGYVISSLEDYNKVLYRDTFEIARGTVNPLRFLNYSVVPQSVKEDKYFPTPEVELRDTKGEMNLVFPVGKSKLDLSLGNNSAELNALIAEFNHIHNSPDMSLKSFSINGYASPEGRYETNQALAEERMRSAMETVTSSIDPSLRRNAELTSYASVAPWEQVVVMMRADGHDNEADKVQDILYNLKNNDSRSIQIAKLPFYRSLIVEKYLPRLRRVNYNITTSVYRPLNDEEIADLYNKNPKGLTKYQYYRYYTSKQGEEREKALRQAVETYPDFVVAATDLAEIMINKGENAVPVLEPFFEDQSKWNRLPEATRLDMAIAYMKEMQYAKADEILETLYDNNETHKAKIYAAAQNGRYQDVIQEINEDSPLNEVLLLLATKNNHEAYEKSKGLGNSAVEMYVKAVAANRLNNYEEATVLLNKAFELDPSLRETAKVDGDVLDLLEDNDTNNTDEL